MLLNQQKQASLAFYLAAGTVLLIGALHSICFHNVHYYFIYIVLLFKTFLIERGQLLIELHQNNHSETFLEMRKICTRGLTKQ